MQSKYISLTLAICTIGFISACKEESRENPLLSKPNREVLYWISQNRSSEIDVCAAHWADPKKALKADLNYCKPHAAKLAKEMNYQGFLEDVREVDINVPIIWSKFHKKISRNAARRIEIEKERIEREKQPKKYFGNF